MTWKQNHEHEHCRIDKWRECSTYIRIMNRIEEKYNKWNGTVQQLQLLMRTFIFYKIGKEVKIEINDKMVKC